MTKTFFHLCGMAAIAFFSIFHVLPATAATSYIYVQTDIGVPVNANSVAAYSNDGAGNLTPLAGSPYLTGGSGIDASNGPEFDADQQLIINPAGTVLYVGNGHSNNISAFTIGSDGTLTAIHGSPFASGGQDPVSLAISGNLLIVANKDQDPNQTSNGPPNYASFPVKADGSLGKRPGSTFALGATSSPAQVLVSALPNLFFGLEFSTSAIGTFNFTSKGVMTELSSVPPPESDGMFLGEILHPTRQILYAGLVNKQLIAVYSYDASGTLTFLRTEANEGMDICWLRTNAAGTRLYTSESVTRSVSVYDISNSKATKPKLLQNFVLLTTDGPSYNIELDPTEEFLYAIVGSQLHVLNVDATGMLSETATPIDLPGVTGASQPVGLAVIQK